MDLSDKMLEVLEKKKLYDGVNLKTVCGSFLDLDLKPAVVLIMEKPAKDLKYLKQALSSF